MARFAHNPKTNECYRVAVYPNFVRVTNASGEVKAIPIADFERWFESELALDLPNSAYEALERLEESFKALYRKPNADQLRKQLARRLGGEILSAPHWRGVGLGCFDKRRPGAIIVHIGSYVKGRGRYATAARFWPANVLEALEALEAL